MMTSKTKSMAAVVTCVLAATLTGCQTQASMMGSSEREDGLSNTVTQTPTPITKASVTKTPVTKTSVIKTEPASYGDDLFYSYPFKTSDLYDVALMKAAGGKLVYRDGCLQLFNGSKYVTPVFPNAVTTFDKHSQTLEMLQVTFNMQDMVMAGGYQTSSTSYLEEHGHKTVTQAPERCLLDEVMVLDGIPNNMGRVDDGLDD